MQTIVVVDEGKKAQTLLAVHLEKMHGGEVEAHEVDQMTAFLWSYGIGM